MLGISAKGWGGLAMTILVMLASHTTNSEVPAEVTAEGFRASLSSETLNVAALHSSLVGPDYERYLSIVLDALENVSVAESERVKANVYEILLVINSAHEVVDPRAWQQVPQDILRDSDSVRAKAAVFARYTPDAFRQQVLDELENALLRLEPSAPSFKPVLESYVHLFKENERAAFDIYLKPNLEKSSIDRGLRIAIIEGAIKSLGLLDAVNYLKSQSIDVRVDGAHALSQIRAGGQHFGTREEEGAVRLYLIETGLDYLCSKASVPETTPVREQHESREIVKAIVLALLRTLGADPHNNSAGQLLVNKEVVGSLKKLQLCLEDEVLSKALDAEIQKFSENGVIRK